MCGLDYENILNPQQTPKHARSMEDGDKDNKDSTFTFAVYRTSINYILGACTLTTGAYAKI